MDKNGPTALLNSVLKIPARKLCTSIILNLKFLKHSFESGREKYMRLLRSFFTQGGQQAQINVCDQRILAKALEDPEKYGGLIVRVGDYSAHFNTLPRNLQEEIAVRNAY